MAASIADDPDDPRHGTLNGYINLRCRCLRCCAANTENHRSYMHNSPEQQEKHRKRSAARRGK